MKARRKRKQPKARNMKEGATANSAKGAKYDSQGQARSASPLVIYTKEAPRPERPKYCALQGWNLLFNCHSESHPRQWVDCFRSFLHPSSELNVIPPTAVGGYFRSFARRNLNNPPTTVGGIQGHSFSSYRNDLNDPPTAVGGIPARLVLPPLKV